MRYPEQSPDVIKVPNKMIQSVKEAHSCYQSELVKRRAEKEDTQKSLKWKIVTAKIKAVKEKKAQISQQNKCATCRGWPFAKKSWETLKIWIFETS